MAFAYYKSATLDHTQAGTADSTDWPLTIYVTDADLKTVGNAGFVQSASGYDIRPYDGIGGSAMTFELVRYVATTGELEMHVKIPTLSKTTDVVIYLYFGNVSLTTDGSSTATWNSNYKGVWHFPDGTSLSTVNSITGASAGSNTSVAGTGQIDGGASFDGVANKMATDLTSFTPDAQMTWGIWQNRTGVGSNNNAKIWTMESATVSYALGNTEGDTPKHYTFFVNGTSGQGSWTIVQPSASAMHHIAITYDGTNGGTPANNDPIIYVDGASVTVTNVTRFTGSQLLGSVEVYLGNRRADTARPFQGTLDEFSVSTGVLRSASWITADYNNQKSSSTFITWGSKVAVPAATRRGLALIGVGN